MRGTRLLDSNIELLDHAPRRPPPAARPRSLVADPVVLASLATTFCTRLAAERRAMGTRLMVLLGALILACASSAWAESFNEHLTLRPLDDGHVHALFNFTFAGSTTFGGGGAVHLDDITVQSFRMLPRALVQLSDAAGVEELDLSLNRGAWDYAAWGSPLWSDAGHDAVGTGAEMVAKLRGQSDFASHSPMWPDTILTPPKQIATADVLAQWRTLTAGLAGLFCASLDTAADQVVVLPSDKTRLHAFLPSEGICTENLSPLVRMLPCHAAGGLGSLLNPHHLFDSAYHGLSVRVRRSLTGWTISLLFQAVFTPSAPREAPMMPITDRPWSMSGLFGASLTRTCPVANTSEVHIIKPSRPARLAAQDGFLRDVMFDALVALPLDVNLDWENSSTPSVARLVPGLSASRAVISSSQERGHVELTVFNPDPLLERRVLYTDVLPALIRPYLHTIQVETSAHPHAPSSGPAVVRYREETLSGKLLNVFHAPGETRGGDLSPAHARPGVLQMELSVPPRSTVGVSYAIDKAMLRYTDHPPDAHRGFDLPPAVVQALDAGRLPDSPRPLRRSSRLDVAKHYTQPALVEVPVPDFSMPYNVIIMVSTIMALFFGSLFNNLYRSYADILVPK